jgi:predicted nucleic acid-binding Zn ribbon protein
MSLDDDASDVEMRDRDLAIAAQRRRATDVLPLPKECANECGTENPPGARFCCTDCREMFEARQKQRRRAGDK